MTAASVQITMPDQDVTVQYACHADVAVVEIGAMRIHLSPGDARRLASALDSVADRRAARHCRC